MKASNGINNNAYFNNAFFIGSGEQALEMKCSDQAFPSGNVPDLQEHYYAAVNDPQLPDPLAGKKSECVAPPIYQTLESGVDAPIYQALSNNRKSPEVRAEKTSERKATLVCQSPNDGVTAPIYQTLNNKPRFSDA